MLDSERGGIASKIAIGVIGSTTVGFGLVLMMLPDSTSIVLPVGMGILATEVAIARGILPRARSRLRTLFARPSSDGDPWRARSGLAVVVAMVTVVASFSASLAFSHLRQRHIEDELAAILHDEGPGLERLSAIRTELRHLGRQVDGYVDRIEAGEVAFRGDIDDARRRRDLEVAAYQSLPSFPGEAELVSELRRRIALADEAAASALDQADRGSAPAAAASLRATFHPRLERSFAAVEHLSTLNSGYVRTRAASVLEARRAGLLIENVLGCVSALSAVVATLLVLRSLRGRARLMEEHGRLLAARATELEAFAGRVAHDLKNPLSAVALRVMSARRDPLTPRLENHLQRVAHQIERMNQIIDGLLAFALAGASPPAGAHASLRDVTAEVVNDLLPAAAAVDAVLRADALPATELACTEGALTSVLSNLVGNAVKYVVDGPELPHRITVHVKDQGDATRVEVEDNGPGLPAGVSQAVFEPFRRFADRQPGIGLGLATVKKIVEAYGGRVGVESTLGHGSSFWFEIPNAGGVAMAAPSPPHARL
jgi:signal transduction histidine kinase